MKPSLAHIALAVAAAASAGAAPATELNWSGYATVGYARSDQPYRYERFIDNGDTLRRDSILGTQLDATFDSRWSLAVQAVLAPSNQDDSRVVPSLRWAVLSYRAGNDILLRAGRLRLPMYINSENLEVGASFDMVRLPSEVYATAPDTNFQGVSASRAWDIGESELSAEAYAGQGTMFLRQYTRDGFAPAGIERGASFGRARAHAQGAVLTLRRGMDVYRLGTHRFKIAADSDSALFFDFTGKGAEEVIYDDIPSRIWTIGADVGVGGEWRLLGEVAHRDVDTINTGYNSVGGYLTLQTRLGNWTPYLTTARLLSHAADRARYNLLNQPASGPVGRLLADFVAPFDQNTQAVGLTYAPNPGTKWKANLMRIRVGDTTGMIDSPAGGPAVAHQAVKVLSLSYNVVF